MVAEAAEDRADALQDQGEALGAFSTAAAAASGAGFVAALTVETAVLGATLFAVVCAVSGIFAWVKRTEHRAEARAAKRFVARLEGFLAAPRHPTSGNAGARVEAAPGENPDQ